MKYSQEQLVQGEELIKNLAQKAWESSSFKEQLVKNPKVTIESLTGSTMPENMKVVVEDQTDESVIYLNIPRKVDFDNIELSDEQLEIIAGGEIVGSVCIGLVVGAAAFGLGYGLSKL